MNCWHCDRPAHGVCRFASKRLAASALASRTVSQYCVSPANTQSRFRSPNTCSPVGCLHALTSRFRTEHSLSRPSMLAIRCSWMSADD